MIEAERFLKRLQFKVVRRLDGMLQGDYTGFFYGPGSELAEVREYQPGDEVRHIDWNVTARMGEVYIRQFVEERELTAWLLVDMSPEEPAFDATGSAIKIAKTSAFGRMRESSQTSCGRYNKPPLGCLERAARGWLSPW